MKVSREYSGDEEIARTCEHALKSSAQSPPWSRNAFPCATSANWALSLSIYDKARISILLHAVRKHTSVGVTSGGRCRSFPRTLAASSAFPSLVRAMDPHFSKSSWFS